MTGEVETVDKGKGKDNKARIKDLARHTDGALRIINRKLDDLAIGQDQLQLTVGDMQADVSALRAGHILLKAGQDTLKTDVNELKTGQAELRADVN
ncbi:MAG: hypothetical protein WCF85_20485, partial [Rhodospirillaceae bacterium]